MTMKTKILCSSGSYYRCNIYASTISMVIVSFNYHLREMTVVHTLRIVCRQIKSRKEVVFFPILIKAKKTQQI